MTYLEHYGVPKRSGRYPWGSGKNPFHHGASSPFGRKSSKKKKEDEAPTKLLNSIEKQNLINSGDAAKVLKYEKQLTNDQLEAAIKRIEKKKKLKNIAKEDKKKGERKLAEVADRVDGFNNSAIKLIKMYNTVATVGNAFGVSDLPTVPIGGDKKKKKD